MSDTPDISKIIGLIMENPDLIEKISALTKGSDTETVTEEQPRPREAKASAEPKPTYQRGDKRARLLSAMKPYLSESRSRAIDSMLGIVNVLDMVRGGG